VTTAILSPELVLVAPELRASACAALPPYPPYPARTVAVSAEQPHRRATQIVIYPLAAATRTAVWGVGVAGALAALAIAAHFA
jgi:hypothetical protein